MRSSKRGRRGKEKLKFSIRSHLQRGDQSKPLDEATEGLERIAAEKMSMAEILGDLQGEIDGLDTEIVCYEERGAIPSVAEYLEDLQGQDALSTGASSLLLQNVKGKERKFHIAGKRTMSSLGSRILDNEDPPEFLGNGMSSEDEDMDKQNFHIATQKMKQTMTDIFQEVYGISTAEEPILPINKQPRHGFHGRLQQILQIEKDEHMEILKKSQKGSNPYDDSRGIDVQIMSRVLEGKLAVCRCLSHQTLKTSGGGPQSCAGDGVTTTRTIIFSSKICDNVELEVGNSIRIHPPWKSVQINEGHQVILCMHFSQVIP